MVSLVSSPYMRIYSRPAYHRVGETIPIRLFLGGFDLTPTFRDVNKKFSTRYYLNLVLIDEENRRYFKQQEITIFRIPEVRCRPSFLLCVSMEMLTRSYRIDVDFCIVIPIVYCYSLGSMVCGLLSDFAVRRDSWPEADCRVSCSDSMCL